MGGEKRGGSLSVSAESRQAAEGRVEGRKNWSLEDSQSSPVSEHQSRGQRPGVARLVRPKAEV